MQTTSAQAGKRQHTGILRIITGMTLALFPMSFLFILDPPQHPNGGLPSGAARVLYTAIAVWCLWWVARRGLPLLKAQTRPRSCFVAALYCYAPTHICAYVGVLTFIASSPKLGSPLIALPYILAAAWVQIRLILPTFRDCQITAEDDNVPAA